MRSAETTAFREGAYVLYDLRDDEAWKRAHRERRAWGENRTDEHVVSPDHVVLAFKPGGATGART